MEILRALKGVQFWVATPMRVDFVCNWHASKGWSAKKYKWKNRRNLVINLSCSIYKCAVIFFYFCCFFHPPLLSIIINVSWRKPGFSFDLILWFIFLLLSYYCHIENGWAAAGQKVSLKWTLFFRKWQTVWHKYDTSMTKAILRWHRAHSQAVWWCHRTADASSSS